jgi:stage II sporulation protein D
VALRSAQRRLGKLLDGRLRQIRVLQRGRSPRVVRAEIVGTGGTTPVTGPALRRKLGLFDTWARFTVITANAARGDGNRPSGSGGSGGSTTPANPTGGASPRRIGAFTAVALPVAGRISGRVTPLVAGAPITIERWSGTRWVAQFDVAALPLGRYSALVGSSGLYRVRHAGLTGPPVRVR